MKPTARVETLGSMWLLDEIDKVYLRLPKGEGPRKSPPFADWGGPDAGVMQDRVWLPFEKWWIEEERRWVGQHADGSLIDTVGPVLRILTHDGAISAPHAQVVT